MPRSCTATSTAGGGAAGDTPIHIDIESTGEKTWSAKVEGSQERDRTHDQLKRRLQEKVKYLLQAQQTPDKIQVYIRPRRATRSWRASPGSAAEPVTCWTPRR